MLDDDTKNSGKCHINILKASYKMFQSNLASLYTMREKKQKVPQFCTKKLLQKPCNKCTTYLRHFYTSLDTRYGYVES